MDTKTIMGLDCRQAKNWQIIQKVLRQVKPLAKYDIDEDIPLVSLERVVSGIVNKYNITPQWMSMAFLSSECGEGVNGRYSVGVKDTVEHQWRGTAVGCTLYEVYAKLVILLYSQVRAGKVGERAKS